VRAGRPLAGGAAADGHSTTGCRTPPPRRRERPSRSPRRRRRSAASRRAPRRTDQLDQVDVSWFPTEEAEKPSVVSGQQPQLEGELPLCEAGPIDPSSGPVEQSQLEVGSKTPMQFGPSRRVRRPAPGGQRAPARGSRRRARQGRR
jgi:hypothetical protein